MRYELTALSVSLLPGMIVIKRRAEIHIEDVEAGRADYDARA
ncbi:hypothetical protein AB0B89_13030 [Sphaerisporangium sp. NPDC049002]